MSNTVWNPRLYLKYEKERTMPARDLLRHVDLKDPHRILDVGCGPGNSTHVLEERWPKAKITGIDNSPEMIEKARQDYPKVTWLVRDAGGDLSDLSRFDLIFSSAALQWMPNHETLLPNIFNLLGRGGVLAVQVPNNFDSPIYTAMVKLILSDKWKGFITEELNHFYDSAATYYRQVSALTSQLSLWETIYYHPMDSLDDIREWHRGAHMRFYLGQLPPDRQGEFEDDLQAMIQDYYKPQPDGKVLFPFRRLFFTAVKT